jgi:hypothetical protein
MYGQSKQQEAYNKVANSQAQATENANKQALAFQQAERARQAALQNQSNALLNSSQTNNSLASQNAKEAEASSSLANQYAAAVSPTAAIPGIAAATDGSQPQAIADSYKQTFGNIGSWLRQQAGNKAAMDAFGNVGLANNIANARALQQQGQIGNWMQGSANVLQNELNANNENSNLAYGNAALAGQGAANQAAIWNGLGGLGMSVGMQGLTPAISSGASKLGSLFATQPKLGSSAAANYPSTGLGPIKP